MAQVSDARLGPSITIPYEAIGANARNAISAVEAREDDRDVLPDVLKTEFFKGGTLRRPDAASSG